MRVTLDATPLLGTRTGIGRYVAELVGALAQLDGPDTLDVRVTTWSARRGRVPDLPDGVRQVGPRIPARALRAAWLRGDQPRIETLVGGTTVFHGTNFVSPPTRRAAEVVTLHDLTYLELPETVAPDSLQYAALVPRALDRGAHVVVPTAATGRAVQERYGLPDERLTVTPLGVDPAWAAATPPDVPTRVRLGLDEEYIVFVGSLDPRKNLGRLIAAHARLRASRPDVPRLVLAGPAGRATDLTGDGIVRTGFLTDSDLRAVVAGARALALPSLDEGFGLPVLEALAAGRPVVAADLPVLREVAGPHAAFADPSDADSIADALGRALDAPDDAASQDSRRAWASRFTWGACARATLGAYRRAAA
ncbi:glycosyltransferase family 1 protein [Cellulomonas sp. URHD0024]|uniref:glycosyltransferase family 4 protein n=1 Tax=Cellulomonas sp. URHD0024 TaxID=1302620 RepID=UPI0018C9E1FB|nr:glycosyltransferase family 1 protein [Cellulomonas sp. URHD0024]